MATSTKQSTTKTTTEYPDPDVTTLQSDVALIKRDILLFDKYFGKIDATIENIDQLTQKMAGIIQLHDERIMNALKEDLQMKQDIKDHKRETHEGFIKVTEKVEAVSKSLDLKIDSMGVSIQNEFKEESKRIHSLDLWRSLIIGGLSVATFVGGIVISPWMTALVKKLFA